ncbi:MAG: hypothetical protein KAH35_02810 [Candidatus Atribacteria bacterium]|nr:hypothetical protein [Candidatus Atribacteria bacterium]
MLNLIKIHWQNDTIKLTGYRQMEEDLEYDTGAFREVEDDVYDYVVENYLKGDMFVFDTELVFTIENITFMPFDDITALKNNALNVYINNELRDDDTSLDFFLISVKFTIINNQMLEKGFIFTPDNKEEVYLDVLNSGDARSIEILEDYIETLDAVTQYSTKVNNYISMKKSMENLTTVEEILGEYLLYTGRNLVDDMNA